MFSCLAESFQIDLGCHSHCRNIELWARLWDMHNDFVLNDAAVTPSHKTVPIDMPGDFRGMKCTVAFSWLLRGLPASCGIYVATIPGGPKNGTVDFPGLCSDQQLFFFTLLDRASFPHHNYTKIIKFGWELFILWVISYELSFSGFTRFPEFRDTINDSFSSKYMRQHMC